MKRMVVLGMVVLALIGGITATAINELPWKDSIKTACIENGGIICDKACNEEQLCIQKEGNDGCSVCCVGEEKERREAHISLQA